MSAFTNINRFYPEPEILTAIVKNITVAEMAVTKGWEKLFHLGGNYITFVLKGEVQIRSNEVIYDGSEVLFNASGTQFFEFKVQSDTLLAIISLKPTTFNRVFRLNPADYNGKYLPAKKAINNDLHNIREELQTCNNYEEIANRLFNWMEPWCKNIRNSNNLIDAVIEYIHSKNGCVKMLDIARRFKISRRSLEKYFKKEIGITPAHYTKTCRFASVLTLLQQSQKEHIDAVISILEYYDYSHFQKDFQRCMGIKFQDYINDKQHPLQEYLFAYNSNFSPVR